MVFFFSMLSNSYTLLVNYIKKGNKHLAFKKEDKYRKKTIYMHRWTLILSIVLRLIEIDNLLLYASLYLYCCINVYKYLRYLNVVLVTWCVCWPKNNESATRIDKICKIVFSYSFRFSVYTQSIKCFCNNALFATHPLHRLTVHPWLDKL